MDIIVINYLEPEFNYTRESLLYIDATRHNIHFVDRAPRGVGSLAEAINRGFRLHVKSEYFMVITNIWFTEDIATKLEVSARKGFDIVQPTYNSDHISLKDGQGLQPVVFTEFTCAVLNSSRFHELGMCDERMPYVGFDIDYGFRCRSCAVNFDVSVQHTYARHLKWSSVTQQRKRLRALAESRTRKLLLQLYNIPMNKPLPAYLYENIH